MLETLYSLAEDNKNLLCMSVAGRQLNLPVTELISMVNSTMVLCPVWSHSLVKEDKLGITTRISFFE